MERLKTAFGTERARLEDRIKLLQEELEQRDREQNKRDRERKVEERVQGKLTDLQKVNDSLKRERDTVSKFVISSLYCCCTKQ